MFISGWGKLGQLCNESLEKINSFVKIDMDKKIMKIMCGSESFLAISKEKEK